jgi:hypothetical protein
MRLVGSLGAFSLPDVFGLLSSTRKTGALLLRGSSGSGAVYFRDGQITGATADLGRQSLARRLIGSGAVDDDAITVAVKELTGGVADGLGALLILSGQVDRDLVVAAATEQSVDAVFELMQWPDGDFSFHVDTTNPDDVGVELAADRLIAEANSRSETWASVPADLLDAGVVLTMPVVLPQDPTATRDEWALLALIDGERTLGDLVDLTGCGRFAVVTTLANLYDRGLLMVRDRRGDHVTSVRRRHALLAPVEGENASASSPAPAAAERVQPDPVTVADPPDANASDEPEPDPGPHLEVELALQSAGTAPQDDPEPVPSPNVESAADEVAPDQPAAATPTEAEILAATGTDGGDPGLNRSLMLRLIAGVKGI